MSTILSFLIAYNLLHVFMWGMYEKAGKPGWHTLIPVLNDMTLCEINGRNKWHALWGLLPFFNLFIILIWLSELLDSFERRKFWEQMVGIGLGPIAFLYIGFNKIDKYHGKSLEKKVKRSFGREWADAIVFAVIAAYVIRTFVVEPYKIPTQSMEGTLLAGDFLFVSKFHYGARIPMTPIAFPFAHHTMPFINTKAYSELIKFKYHRLPGLQKIKRNDKVVFNFPAGDTVALERQSETYYDITRNEGWESVQANYHVTSRPVDKRENYVKRCVAIPGDVLSVEQGEVYIDGKPGYKPKKRQFFYSAILNSPFSYQVLNSIDIKGKNFPNNKDAYDANTGAYFYFMSPWQVAKLKSFQNVNKVGRYYNVNSHDGDERVYPNQPSLGWNQNNFGPLKIPNEGYTVKLDSTTYYLYERCIRIYEGNKLEMKSNGFYINNKKTDTYTFKMNYYFMMGDNRDNSLDSRFWGMVPEDHIVGKPLLVWMSFDPYERDFLKSIRWKRFFKPIHGNSIENKDLF